MSVDLIEGTLLIRDPNAAQAFAECDRRRQRATAKTNAMLEAQFGPANRPDDKWENGVNLWRENRLDLIAIECSKVLLKINGAGDELQLSTEDQNRLIWCIQEVRSRIMHSELNREIVDELVSRAVKLTDAANKDAAVKILCQRKWWWD